MPTNISVYQECIRNLPVRNQAFTTNRNYEKWKHIEDIFNWYQNLNNIIFDNNLTYASSRQNLFNEQIINTEKLLKIFYWGYPKGFQGYTNNVNLISNLELISTELNRIKLIDNLTTNDFLQFHNWTQGIDGLGISTYSKFLYFCEIRFNNIPAIILDSRLMKVFNNNIFNEYHLLNGISVNNAHNKYIDYLHLTHDLATLMNTNEENIEQFLFIFGNNLI